MTLGSAKEEADLSFQLPDKRDYGHIGYRQYNKAKGKEVPRDKIVKGYEYESGKYVVVTDEDIKRANPRAVSTIDIEDFVQCKEMDPMPKGKVVDLMPLLKQSLEAGRRNRAKKSG